MTSKNEPIRDLILFIDDEKICHTLVELIIPNYTKFKVLNAFSAEEAMALAKRYGDRLVLILSDIMLPDKNGYDIFSAFQKDKKLKNIPFIFQSGVGFHDNELAKRCAKNSQIIYKPYNQKDLLSIIKKTLVDIDITDPQTPV